MWRDYAIIIFSLFLMKMVHSFSDTTILVHILPGSGPEGLFNHSV